LLARKGENMLRVFERRILRRICGSIKENGSWRSRCSHGLYKLYKKPDKVKMMEVGRLSWLEQLLRMQAEPL
jgi:hypothetical protein